jgi:hypothetical protein
MRRAFVVAAILVIDMIFPGKNWLRDSAAVTSPATRAAPPSRRVTVPPDRASFATLRMRLGRAEKQPGGNHKEVQDETRKHSIRF